MGFAARLGNSWTLFKASWSVMKRNKTLLVFPIVTAFLMVVILVFFFSPILFQSTGYGYGELAHWQAVFGTLVSMEPARVAGAAKSEPVLTQGGMGILCVLYFVSMFVAVFCNVAFYHEILRAFEGEAVSIRRGFGFATKKIGAIFLWSLFAGLVGYLIRLLEEKVGFLGRIVLGLIGMAWSAAVVFVVPAIVTQPGINPLEKLRNSATILKKTWGESVVGFLGMQLSGFLLILVSLVAWSGIGIAYAMLPKNETFAHFGPVGLFLGAVLWVVALVAWFYVMSVANHVYRCALYVYASQGRVLAPFDRSAMDLAWKTKKPKK